MRQICNFIVVLLYLKYAAHFWQHRDRVVSERRNELIAEMLHHVHFIEKWGRGIKLILSKEPDVEFSEVGTKFVTTFKRRSYFEGKKGFEKLGEKGRGSKEKSKEKILRLMIENSAITIQEIAEILGMSLAGVEKSIRILKQQERLRRIGPDKGGHWEVVKK